MEVMILDLISKKNQPPGSPIYTGVHQVETLITHIVYNKDELKKVDSLSLEPGHNNWFIFKGLNDTQKIKSICEEYNVDSLVMEDILNVNQRNKIEFFETYIFAVVSYAYLHENQILHDYLSVLMFKDKVFTFHEHNINLFEEVYKRLENNKGIIRSVNHDYLFYVILDTIIDNDIVVEREISNRTAKLEEDIIALESTDQTLLYNSRKELLFLKKTIDPIYESFTKMEYKTCPLIAKELYKYFGDVSDHIKRTYEEINIERELLRNLLDVHMNNVSNKMNAIMKTLTIFSAIFIPLSFLAGVFGMNFVEFPLLSKPYGLTIFIGICLTIAITMVFYFRNRKWF